MVFSVKWFKAPLGAKVLPVRHQYVSTNWYKGIAYPERVGEAIGVKHTWSNGAAVTGYNGLNYCGTQWTGNLVQLASPMPSHPDGSPACCAPRPTVPCSGCMEGSGWAFWNVNASGGTGDFAPGNGVFPAGSAGGCNWTFSTPPLIAWTIQVNIFRTKVILTVGVGVTAEWDLIGQPHCQRPLGPIPLSSFTGSGTPPTVSLS